jgi:hypothetical protein
MRKRTLSRHGHPGRISNLVRLLFAPTQWPKLILDADDPNIPSIDTRLALVKLFLELSFFTPALLVLHGVMSTDDQVVEAWYLEGWCFFLMAEQARETGGTVDDLTWEDLGKDARDCLETCRLVSLQLQLYAKWMLKVEKLHVNEGHPDLPMLDHANELINQLDELGIKPSPQDGGDAEGNEEEEWEDASDDDDDVHMKI